MKIGFIGLGIMGSPMAANLLRVGTSCSSTAFPACHQRWSTRAESHARAARKSRRKSDIIITMVPDTPHVEAALFADNGVAEGVDARARPSST